MKKYYALLFALTFCFRSEAQSDAQINDWFYDLPVKETPFRIREALLAGDFVESNAGCCRADSTKKYAYFIGKINKPGLPKVLKIDSTKVTLACGKIYDDKSAKKPSKQYRGEIKILTFEYFVESTQSLKSAYKQVKRSLREGSKYCIPFSIKNHEHLSSVRGRSICYKDKSSGLSEVRLYELNRGNGVSSLVIEYTGSL